MTRGCSKLELQITPKPANLRWISGCLRQPCGHRALRRPGSRRFASTAPFVSIIPRATLLTRDIEDFARVLSIRLRGGGRAGFRPLSSNGTTRTRDHQLDQWVHKLLRKGWIDQYAWRFWSISTWTIKN